MKKHLMNGVTANQENIAPFKDFFGNDVAVGDEVLYYSTRVGTFVRARIIELHSSLYKNKDIGYTLKRRARARRNGSGTATIYNISKVIVLKDTEHSTDIINAFPLVDSRANQKKSSIAHQPTLNIDFIKDMIYNGDGKNADIFGLGIN